MLSAECSQLSVVSSTRFLLLGDFLSGRETHTHKYCCPGVGCATTVFISGGGSPGQRLSPGSGKGRAFPGKQWMSHCRPDEERGERVLRVVWREYHVVKQPVFAGSCKHAVLYCQKVNCKSREGDEGDKPIRILLPKPIRILLPNRGIWILSHRQ